MERESQIGIEVKVGISVYRQIAIAIARRYLKKKKIVDNRDDEEDMEDNNGDSLSYNHILDL